MRPAKTLEEHREYLDQIVGLQLFFLAQWAHEHPAEAFVDILRHRVDIYRKTDANPGPAVPDPIRWEVPAWKTLEERLGDRFSAVGGDPGRFEVEGLAILKDTLDARCPRDFKDPTLLAPYDCGCLRHEPHQDAPGVIGFHIANPLSPGSIFDDPLYVPACFMVLINQCEQRLGGQKLETTTWLNEHPRWLANFPQQWRDSLSPPDTDVAWHYGFWGQFVTARGTFQEAAGRYLRSTGRFPFYPRKAGASMAVLRRHFGEVLRRG